MKATIIKKAKSLANVISLPIIFLSLALVFFTHYKINLANIGSNTITVPKYLLTLDIMLIVIICSIIGYKIHNYIVTHIKNQSHSKLEKKIIQIIISFAVVPPILCLIYFYIYFTNSSKMWFNNAIDQSLQESLEISKIYIDENKQQIKDNLFQLKRFTEKNTDLLISNPIKFEKKFSALAASRSITEAVILIHGEESKNTKILSKTSFSFYPSVENFNLSEDYFPNDAGISIKIDDDDNYMRAISALDNMPNTYILIGVLINDKVVRHIKNVEGANRDYNTLKSNIQRTQKQFLVSFSTLSFLLILTLILLFMNFVAKYIFPLVEVIGATQKVSKGDYNVKLEEKGKNAEIALLFSSFNNMIKLIAQKNCDLSYSKQLSETQKDFLEYLLGSLPSGVLYLNTKKHIKLYNITATEIFEHDSLYNYNLLDNLPALNKLLSEAEKKPDHVHQAKITAKINGKNKTFRVLVSLDFAKGEIRGFIINLLPIDLT